MTKFLLKTENGTCEIEQGTKTNEDTDCIYNITDDEIDIPDEHIDTKIKNKYKIVNLSKGKYYGEMKFNEKKQKPLPHGIGTYEFFDGSEIYQGNFHEGIPNGHGKRIKNDTVFEGTFNRGKMESGTFLDVNNNIYKGTWNKNKRQGKFIIRYVNGYRCIAYYKDDIITDCQLLLKNDTTFKYKTKSPEEPSQSQTDDKNIKHFSTDKKFIYTGPVLNGIPYSDKQASSKNLTTNEIYKGPFNNGLQYTSVIEHQKATLTSIGSNYIGSFDNGTFNGYGKHESRNLTSQGYFENGLINDEFGQLTWNDGTVFKGKVSKGIPVQGEFILPDESVLTISLENLNQYSCIFKLTLNPSPKCKITGNILEISDSDTVSMFIKLLKFITPTDYFSCKLYKNLDLINNLKPIIKLHFSCCNCCKCNNESIEIFDKINQKFRDTKLTGTELLLDKVNFIEKVFKQADMVDKMLSNFIHSSNAENVKEENSDIYNRLITKKGKLNKSGQSKSS